MVSKKKKEEYIKDGDSPLLKQIEKQRKLKENRVISEKEKEKMVQEEQIRIDNDIKGCYITFNIMFYTTIILILIPLTFIFRGMTIEEILNFYGIYAVFGRNIVLLPLVIMFFMWQTAKKRDILHPSTIKMRKLFKIIFIITMILIVISLMVFGSSIKDWNLFN